MIWKTTEEKEAALRMAPISPKGNLKAHAEPKGKPKAKETEHGNGMATPLPIDCVELIGRFVQARHAANFCCIDDWVGSLGKNHWCGHKCMIYGRCFKIKNRKQRAFLEMVFRAWELAADSELVSVNFEKVPTSRGPRLVYRCNYRFHGAIAEQSMNNITDRAL